MALYQMQGSPFKPTMLGELSQGVQGYQANKQQFDLAQLQRQNIQSQIGLREAQTESLSQPSPVHQVVEVGGRQLLIDKITGSIVKNLGPVTQKPTRPLAPKHKDLFNETTGQTETWLLDEGGLPTKKIGLAKGKDLPKELSPSQQIAELRLKVFQNNPELLAATLTQDIDAAKLNLATGLRKEFNAAKVFKDFQTVNRSERAMKQALDLSLNPDQKSKIASDQALGVLFQKMLDPDSVVRESEYARTGEGASLLNRMMAWLPKLQKGGLAISDDDRQALYDIAQKLLNESKITMNAHIERYEGLAEDYGVDHNKVIGRNIQQFKIGGAEATTNQDIFTVGETRQDTQGNQRKYIGTGQWQLVKPGEKKAFTGFPTKHPAVKNPDGSKSNVKLAGFNISGKEYVIPTMVGGKQLTDEQAVKIAKENGLEKYPSFDTVEEANKFAEQFHDKIGANGNIIQQKMIGKIIPVNGHNYKIVGFADDGEPLVEPVK